MRGVSSKTLTGVRQLRSRGGRGLDDVLWFLGTLVQYGAKEDVITELKDNLKYLKEYIKSDYKVKDDVNGISLFIV